MHKHIASQCIKEKTQTLLEGNYIIYMHIVQILFQFTNEGPRLDTYI